MKKLFLMLIAAVTLNANAAIIEISTDKSSYDIGETITATISLSSLSNVGALPTLFDVYNTAFSFDTSLLSYVAGSAASKGPFGALGQIADPLGLPMPSPVIELFLPLIEGNLATVGSFAFQGPGVDIGYQFQNVINDLYTVQFSANAVGRASFSPLSASIAFGGTLGDGLPQNIEFRGTSFDITQVPAPGTFTLSLLALGGMFFARKRAK